ncbi:MAG: HD domain-containing protein [Xylanivirga thermophila]|jgi:putative hydrolases of HD superfamily|uniref:HD domain-containing protein n=1 Tax=Xylanivirga thermophila TaxID=2496273 RepID=UPI00101D9B34|nr:HD domain-containing protein [Xylanivirga thermophila]
MDKDRLSKQMQFIKEIDKAKEVYRQTVLMDASRRENDAEHSWHIAIMAMLLGEYVDDKDMDFCRVIKMVLVHDLVEIYAGDTFCYDEKAGLDKSEREIRSARKLFGMLPEDQCDEFMELWREFEERSTPEARFGAALDRLQPLYHNYMTKGYTWREHDVDYSKVIERNKYIKDSSEVLWEYAQRMIDDSVEKGYLKHEGK